MADYIVKDTELTSVANAIRTAGGTNSLLSFPNGFVSAVENIGGGGGSSDFSTAEVTFINAGTTTSPYAVNAFYVDSDCINMSPFDVSESVTIEVPLYKGKTEMSASILRQTSQSYMPTTTGGVSLVLEQGAPKFVITGDGTITAKGLKLE